MAESLSVFADSFWGDHCHSIVKIKNLFENNKKETKIISLIREASSASDGMCREALLEVYEPDYPYQTAEAQSRTQFSFDKMVQRAKSYASQNSLSIQECFVGRKIYVSSAHFPRVLNGMESSHILPTLMEHYKAYKRFNQRNQGTVFQFMKTIANQVSCRKNKIRHNLLSHFLTLISDRLRGISRGELIGGLYPSYGAVSHNQQLCIDKCLNRLTQRLRRELRPFGLNVVFYSKRGSYSLTLK